jgi:helicase
MHLLAAIATQFVHDAKGMYTFIQSTFYAYQTDEFTIKKEVDTALEFLLDNQLIEKINTGYLSTLFGSRTSSLYIDPLSAIQLKTALERSHGKETTSLSFLHAICSTPDIRSLYLRGTDSWVEEKVEHIQHLLLLDIPAKSSDEYEWFLSDLKTAFLLDDWIEEQPYDALVLKYNIWPGDVHTIVEMAEWLLHATREYARMYNFSCVSDINNILLRVQTGCKEELLNLVSLQGIGRVRARALYREGFKSVNDLRNVPVERLAKIKMIGKAVAMNIKQQIGENGLQGNKVLRGSKR